MLHDPARHEPLIDTAWDAGRARAALAAIAADLAAAFTEDALWPVHPLDRGMAAPRYTCLYHGAAGVLWAQHHLAAEGAIAPVELAPRARAVLAHHRRAPDAGAPIPSFWVGEVGVLLATWRLDPSAVALSELRALVDANRDHPANEPFLGASGTLLAAVWLAALTEDPAWRSLADAHAEAVRARWQPDPRVGCSLWIQDLYGEIVDQLGAAHGLAGNVYALLRVRRDPAVILLAAEAVHATALERDGLVNWPQYALRPRRGRTEVLVQWCHGAPGMITALSPFLDDDESTRLLLAGGELIWRAGPLVKGAGLCHGTAGNGFALLELFRRTGDAQWLERARSFAMHAIAQSERMAAAYGQRRYSLYTGDAGLAIYLHACLTGRAGMPLLDVF